MLFVFAYVDLFSLYRPDFRADIAAGEVAGSSRTRASCWRRPPFVIPSLMVFCVLVLPPRLNRTSTWRSPALRVTMSPAPSASGAYYVLGSLSRRTARGGRVLRMDLAKGDWSDGLSRQNLRIEHISRVTHVTFSKVSRSGRGAEAPDGSAPWNGPSTLPAS